MAAQTMVQQQGGGQSIQQQGGRQTAQLAGSKTGWHEPAACAADETPKSPNRRGTKKQKVIIHPTSVTTLQKIRALRVPAALDGYQCAAGSIFQRELELMLTSVSSVGTGFWTCLKLLGFGQTGYRQRYRL